MDQAARSKTLLLRALQSKLILSHHVSDERWRFLDLPTVVLEGMLQDEDDEDDGSNANLLEGHIEEDEMGQDQASEPAQRMCHRSGQPAAKVSKSKSNKALSHIVVHRHSSPPTSNSTRVPDSSLQASGLVPPPSATLSLPTKTRPLGPFKGRSGGPPLPVRCKSKAVVDSETSDAERQPAKSGTQPASPPSPNTRAPLVTSNDLHISDSPSAFRSHSFHPFTPPPTDTPQSDPSPQHTSPFLTHSPNSTLQ